jgi:hypothetical protein
LVFFPPKIAEIRPAIILIKNDKRVFWFLLPMFCTVMKKNQFNSTLQRINIVGNSKSSHFQKGRLGRKPKEEEAGTALFLFLLHRIKPAHASVRRTCFSGPSQELHGTIPL